MVLQVLQPNEIKVYNVTAGKNIPEWVANKRKKALRYDVEYRTRVEFIQDLEFPQASNRIKMSPDQKYLIATGVYKPQVRCFEMSELSMKFERHMDCEVVQFQVLSDDWTKIAFLQMDRTVEFHSQAGTYYKTRIPKYGRDIAYDRTTCDLIAVGVGSEAWRLNLDLGRFMAPFKTECSSINVCKISPVHNLYAFGSEDGKVEFWDPRMKRNLGALEVGGQIVKQFVDVDSAPEITAFRYHTDGLTFAVGSSSGHVLLYDLRKDSPFLTKDHQYQYPIHDIKFHSSGNIISADTKIIKIWNQQTGEGFTTIEPPSNINDVCVFPDTGLLVAANESSKVQAFYIPQLGPAPKWSSFLDNLTEEMEENPTPTVYDDYKFVTRKELEALGLEHLYGTNLLKAYMHGFFIDIRLYEKAKSIANPLAYDEYRKKMTQQKIENQATSRISIQRRKLPKINKGFAERLLNERGITAETNTENPLGDERFQALFQNPEFEVDMESEEFKLLHPQKRIKALKQNFKKVEDTYKGEKEGRDSDLSSDSDSDDELAYQLSRKRKGGLQVEDVDFESDEEEEEEKPQKNEPKFFEIKTGHSVQGLGTLENEEIRKQKKRSFGERLESTDIAPITTSRNPMGNMEIKFFPKADQDKQKRPAAKHEFRERRGVNTLKFKKLPSAGHPKFKRGSKGK